ATERRRILTLPRRDGEEPPVARPVVEEEAVGPASDDDHRPEVGPGDLRLDAILDELDRDARERRELDVDVPDRLALLELPSRVLLREPRAQLAEKEPGVRGRPIEPLRQLRDEVG